MPKHARLHRLFYAAGFVAILLTLAAVDASAQPSSDWVRAEYGQVRLIAASEGLSDDGQISVSAYDATNSSLEYVGWITSPWLFEVAVLPEPWLPSTQNLQIRLSGHL